jgi:hypothetical protein
MEYRRERSLETFPGLGGPWYRHRRRLDIQHNDIQHNDTQHNDFQYNDIQHNDTHRDSK